MTVLLSPVGGVAGQFFDNNGNPLTGGKIYTYAAGTTTPQATYTTIGGTVAHSNPIILDAGGRVPSGEIWLTDGIAYKFALKSATDVLIGTYDNLTGINSNFVNFLATEEIQTATASQTVFTLVTTAYQPGTNSLSVFVDGVNQYDGSSYAYVETNSTTVTFTAGLHVGALVKFTTVQTQSAGATDASQVSYTPAGTGAVATTVQAKLRESVSVLDFGAIGNGTANDTNAFNNAIATGKQVYVPTGTYLVNAIIPNRTVIYGDGNTVSIIKPFNTAIAALTYTYIDGAWTYHSEIRNLGFAGTSKVGVGFTFGTTVPANYTTNMEYCRNVKFFGCDFEGLEKGVQFPFGNIGSEFYSCGFSANKYGVYTINDKFGAGMHAGNKYFYAGEMHGNDCAVYANNTIDGFGSIVFNGTIFEYNLIVYYGYNSSTVITPIAFTDCWFEGNGAVSSGAATVTIDSWSGSTVSTQTLAKRSLIFDGTNCTYSFKNSFVSDFYLKGQVQNVFVTDCRVETVAGFNGNPFTVDYPANSTIYFKDVFTDSGRIQTAGSTVNGAFMQSNYVVGVDQNGSNARAYLTNSRASKVANYGASIVFAAPLNTAATLTGSATVVGNVIGDGVLYNQCNEFTKASFLSSELLYLSTPNSIITTAAGWYVVTFDFKVTSGNPTFNISDGSTAFYITGLTVPSKNIWYSYAAMAYFDTAKTLGVSFAGNNATCVWKLSAYQMHRFDTRTQAINFLSSNVFSES